MQKWWTAPCMILYICTRNCIWTIDVRPIRPAGSNKNASMHAYCLQTNLHANMHDLFSPANEIYLLAPACPDSRSRPHHLGKFSGFYLCQSKNPVRNLWSLLLLVCLECFALPDSPPSVVWAGEGWGAVWYLSHSSENFRHHWSDVISWRPSDHRVVQKAYFPALVFFSHAADGDGAKARYACMHVPRCFLAQNEIP